MWRLARHRSPGTLFAGADMVLTYAHREAARFLACCWLVGAVLGAIVALLRGEQEA